MTFGSLFSGIGGMDLGLERAGMECKWQVEIEPYCQKVLAMHWPGVKRYGDIKTITGSELESVDLIAGGFPCQDISYAGAGAGIDGERSGLWSEMLRIICLVRPRFVLVENVPALLTRGMGRVLGELAESGYDTEWQCLPAAAFGAPHIRFRAFIVAYAERSEWRSHPTSHRRLAGENSLSQGQESTGRAGIGGEDVADAGITGLQEPQQTSIFSARRRQEGRAITQCDWWATEPELGRVANGVPHRVDRLKGLGNAVVPQVAEWIGHRIMEAANAA